MSCVLAKALDGAPVSKFPTPHFEFPASGEEPRRTIALWVAARRARASWSRDPRFALSQELEAKQTLFDQLRALATDDPDFFTGLLEGAARTGNYRPDETEPSSINDDTLKAETNPAGLVSCSVRVWQYAHGQWFPITGVARWEEFAPIKTV
jgi:hypothetical protein